ncbi:hypothetical protein [Sphingomonas jatrophae]|uniref:Uncharacterized protein n=1 Tax=Sphingomonas jatrophae TaxID=1166337 RepID=A0A1I6L4G2_9SPHN|nr:hypothetical protein [Sphingomonas jatrophae]SFR98307.1 hypothetical protein SAMN05192580_2271 [Sphingomonas jatrophae]
MSFFIILAAAQVASSPTPPVAAQPAAEERQICRREAITGTRLSKRTCRSVGEWKAIDAQAGAGASGLNGATSLRQN